MATSASGSPSSRSEPQALGRLVVQLLFASEKHTPGPIKRIVAPAAVAELFDLDAPAHGVEAAIGQRDDVEGVDHLGRFGQDDRVHRGIGGRHVEGAEADPFLPGSGCLSIQPATSVYLRVGRMSMIWWFSTSATVVA